MTDIKTLQEEKDLYVTIGKLIVSCGNVYNEQGANCSATIGEYIFKEKQKSYTLGMMKGVKLVEGVVSKIEPIGGELWFDGEENMKDKVLSNITNLKQELNAQNK